MSKEPGERSTDTNNYPIGRSEYALRNIDSFAQNAKKHGENIGIYTRRLLAGNHPSTR